MLKVERAYVTRYEKIDHLATYSVHSVQVLNLYDVLFMLVYHPG